MLTAAAAASLDRAGFAAGGGRATHQFLADMQERMELGVGVALVSPDGDFLLSSRAHRPSETSGRALI